MFNSQAATTIRENKTETQQDVDDFLYELPDTIPTLELGDRLLNSLGTTAKNLFDNNAPPSKKEEDIMDEYEIEKIRDTMDETAQVPESIFFFLRWRQ